MNQERMEEECISRLHLDMDSGFDVYVFCGEETEIDSIPIGFGVLGQLPAVTRRNDREAAVFARAAPNRRPRPDDSVGWPDCEVA